MRKAKLIGITAVLLAALAGCSGSQTDYMELRQQAIDELNREDAVLSVDTSTTTMGDESETMTTELCTSMRIAGCRRATQAKGFRAASVL